jgi:hypothetical protein
VTLNSNNKISTAAVFLDIQRAFGTAWHTGLLYKLYNWNFRLHQAGGETLVSVIHKLITSIWNKEEMPDQWKESIIVSIHKTGDKID